VKLREMEYDFILGMNWLSAYHASVNCYEKRVTFRMERILSLLLRG